LRACIARRTAAADAPPKPERTATRREPAAQAAKKPACTAQEKVLMLCE
jgi:hypothetical protein